MKRLGAAAVLLALCSACAPRGGEPLAVLPDFAMTAVGQERDAPFTRRDLLGRVWIADFVFTRCGGPCPVLTTRLAALGKRLPDTVGLLTVSVDPEGDTPERLRAYARSHGARDGRWVFLRGDARQTYRLMYAGFRLPMSTDPSAAPETRVTHSTRLALVDKRGRVRAFYDGLDEGVEETLARDARRLDEEGS
jgi:cytochrome oxidase Cu insertion factor (SCO1/SenC/PrrC family)